MVRIGASPKRTIFAAPSGGKRVPRGMSRPIHRSAWKVNSPKFTSLLGRSVRVRARISGAFLILGLLVAHLLGPPVLEMPCPLLYARSPRFARYRKAEWSWSHSDAPAWLPPTPAPRRWRRREPHR